MADRSAVIHHTDLEEGRSLAAIVQDVLRDLQNMMRAEIRLARAEMAEKAQRAGSAAGLFGAAAVCGLLAAAAFVTTCIAALALVMPVWLAALLMCLFLVMIGGACYAGGRSRWKQTDLAPRQTVDTLKEDVEWAKRQIK
ncbi:MAG TPA: phage holin family protein [Bryobacteraceae bacterium]|jgi:hypothetical protein